MAEKLKIRLKQQEFESIAHEAVLNLLVASATIRRRIENLCNQHGISSAQYNVLRILRGKYPDGYARCDIITRMIERAPDVTRLIDRMVRMNLVERAESPEDRRLSIARITPHGLSVLESMEPELRVLYRDLEGRVAGEEFEKLSSICEKLYNID